MSRGSDLAGFIRGLESITKALVETQGPEWRRVWQNSSVKSVISEMGQKSEEIISNRVSQQTNPQVFNSHTFLSGKIRVLV